MTILGKRGCNHKNNWEVTIRMSDGEEITIASQLSEQEAKSLQVNIGNKMNSNSAVFEVEIEQDCSNPMTIVFNKSLVSYVYIND